MKIHFLLIILLFVTYESINGLSAPDAGNLICKFSNETALNEDTKNFVSGCQACYSYWKYEGEKIQILGQGCWLNLDGCLQNKCIHTKYANKGEDVKDDENNFCCCVGDNCNADISSRILHLPPAVIPPIPVNSSYKLNSYIVIGVIVASALISLIVVILGFYLTKYYIGGGDGGNRINKSEKFHYRDSSLMKSNNNNHVIEMESSQSKLINDGNYDLSGLEIKESELVIGNGEFNNGVTYKGLLNGNDVAVKISNDAEAFNHEKDVYQLLSPHDRPQFCHFYGSQQNFYSNGLRYESILVLSYVENGTLASYLKSHTLNWPQLCGLLKSLSEGLTQLHSEEYDKPTICHTNLNSRNIYVENGYTCCIGDFSHAYISGNKYYNNIIKRSSYRYMAPERLVVQGALNLRDVVTSLKQADVYSMGLIFWEMSRRCHDLYQGSEVPEFEMAFNKEIGNSKGEPSLEQMTVLVSRNKARPLFPEVWKNSNPAIQQLKETIEDSWDHEGEARLTTFGVLERISELSVLWNRYYKKRNPNNSNNNITATSNNIVRNNVNSVFHLTNNFPNYSPNVPLDIENISEKNDNVRSNQQPVQQIQPHQGRNPCLERNFNINAADNLSLVEKSSKETFSPTETETEPAIRFISSQPVPIPYLQNDFSGVDLDSNSRNLPPLAKEKNKNHNKSHWLKDGKSKIKNVVILEGASFHHQDEIKSNLELQKQRQLKRDENPTN